MQIFGRVVMSSSNSWLLMRTMGGTGRAGTVRW